MSLVLKPPRWRVRYPTPGGGHFYDTVDCRDPQGSIVVAGATPWSIYAWGETLDEHLLFAADYGDPEQAMGWVEDGCPVDIEPELGPDVTEDEKRITRYLLGLLPPTSIQILGLSASGVAQDQIGEHFGLAQESISERLRRMREWIEMSVPIHLALERYYREPRKWLSHPWHPKRHIVWYDLVIRHMSQTDCGRLRGWTQGRTRHHWAQATEEVKEVTDPALHPYLDRVVEDFSKWTTPGTRWPPKQRKNPRETIPRGR